jgi:iron(III) transport system substrate-binding protein
VSAQAAALAQEPPNWPQVVAAARGEGGLSIIGPPGTDARDALTVGFQRKYPEIQVEFNGMSSGAIGPKLLAEREAGQYRADLYVGGTGTVFLDLMPVGAVDPILPYLAGPETREQSMWMGGKFDFADNDEKYTIAFLSGVKSPLAYNPSLVSASEFRSYKDLLDPRWRGKMALTDPRTAGPGPATATFFYTTPGLGKEYLRQLFATGVVLSKDDRQILDWVARGQYPLAISPSERQAAEMKAKGVPIELLSGNLLEESTYLSISFGAVTVINRPPHPNAVKLYLDWLLSQEGQTASSKASSLASRRLDVPTDHVNPAMVPQPGVQYQENYKEAYIPVREELAQFLAAELPR